MLTWDIFNDYPDRKTLQIAKFDYICIVMRIEGKIWHIILIVCLALSCFDKADYLPYADSDDSLCSILSEITTTDTNLIEAENLTFSVPETVCRVPRQTNFSNSLRTISQVQRQNSSTNHARNGFILTKSGKSMNEYTTSLFLISILNFPSGMNETNHHLIGLRKLII